MSVKRERLNRLLRRSRRSIGFQPPLHSAVCLILFSLSLVASPFLSFAGSNLLLEENFEGYRDNAEFEAAWPKLGNAKTRLTKDPDDPANTVLSSKGDRRTRAFPVYTPSDTEPLRVSFRYYDNFQEDLSGREYVGLWSGPSDPTALIEIGQHNHPDVKVSRFYNARCGTDEEDWFDLKAKRRPGWRRILLMIYAETVEIYIDGDLDTVADWTGGELGAIRLGSGFGTGETASETGACYDDLRIEAVTLTGEERILMELSKTMPRSSHIILPET